MNLLLDCKKMARSVFYSHRARINLPNKYEREKQAIKKIFHEHKQRYGYGRITAQMRNDGYSLHHKTVRGLMGEMGLKCRIRKVRYPSYKGEVRKIAPNILNRNFTAKAPNQKWATDITQIKIKDTKLYLSPIIDMFNGEIIAYNISKSANLEQVYDMLDKAFKKVPTVKATILHFDQGWQYQHLGYRTIKDHGGGRKYVQKKGTVWTTQ